MAQELMERLNEARSKADEIDRERSRLTGQNDNEKKRLAELEETCKEKFNCDVGGLADLIEQAEKDADKTLIEAEQVLGLREGAVATATPVETEVPEQDESEDDALPPDEDGLPI